MSSRSLMGVANSISAKIFNLKIDSVSLFLSTFKVNVKWRKKFYFTYRIVSEVFQIHNNILNVYAAYWRAYAMTIEVEGKGLLHSSSGYVREI